ncbi:MAG TPA: recombinase family protein [Symbiobacteriaceae bacterium]|nr:recombinase family protein [Symbiobacteriaceae bacterium]
MEGLIARAYIRVSTEEQAQRGFSLPAQRERLESFAKSQGWTLARVYEDDGYSAKDTNRPALQEMLEDVQPGEVILAYKLDRLTRSVLDLYELMKLFDKREVLFKSATEEFNTTTPHGRLMITLVAVLAQWERETIAERVKMGRQKKAASGEWPGGPLPFGYVAQPGKARGGRTLLQLVPDPERAHLVQEAFDRYLAGQGVRGLCLWLNDQLGVRTTSGGRWRVTAMTRLLTNPIYCGDVVHGRRVDGPVTRVKGSHEPIVSEETFEKVQSMFQRRKELPPRQATGGYPLAGVAKCGVCGGPISAAVNSKDGLYYYRCLNYVKGLGCGTPALTSIPGPLAEAEAVEQIHALSQPERLDTFLAECETSWAAKLGIDSAEIRRLENDLQEARTAITRWDHAYETGKLDFDDYLARVQPHKDRIKVIEQQLEKAKEIPAPPARETLVANAIDFKLVWGLASPPERKALLLRVLPAYGAKVVLHRERLVTIAPAL